MAAPASAYTGLSLFIGDCEHGQAILAPDYSTFKTRFYLDEVVGGKEGVVGLVNPLGANAKYHNLVTRQGKGRFGNYVALNDGGLNTYGHGEITSINPVAYANRIKLASFFRSAYYANSSVLGYRMRLLGGGGSWNQTPISGITLNQQLTRTATVDILSAGFTDSGTYEIQPYITNSEGTFYGDTQTVYANSAIAFINATKRVSNLAARKIHAR